MEKFQTKINLKFFQRNNFNKTFFRFVSITHENNMFYNFFKKGTRKKSKKEEETLLRSLAQSHQKNIINKYKLSYLLKFINSCSQSKGGL